MVVERKVTRLLTEQCKERMEPYSCEGFLLGGGNSQSNILFVGEAPGRQELIDGAPFTGKAGEVMDKYFSWLGIEKCDVYITSVVKSRPYKTLANNKEKPIHLRGNRTPNQAEIRAHAPLLDAQIKNGHAKVIVTLGAIAFKRITGFKSRLVDVHGTPFSTTILTLQSMKDTKYTPSEESYTIFPTFHPASIFYNQKLEQTIKSDMKQLKKLLKKMDLY